MSDVTSGPIGKSDNIAGISTPLERAKPSAEETRQFEKEAEEIERMAPERRLNEASEAVRRHAQKFPRRSAQLMIDATSAFLHSDTGGNLEITPRQFGALSNAFVDLSAADPTSAELYWNSFEEEDVRAAFARGLAETAAANGDYSGFIDLYEGASKDFRDALLWQFAEVAVPYDPEGAPPVIRDLLPPHLANNVINRAVSGDIHHSIHVPNEIDSEQ